MKIILTRISVVIGVLILIAGIIIGINEYFANKNLQKQLSQFTGKYIPLSQECLKNKESASCCLSSVASMQGAEGFETTPK
jgi:uncharacterized protein YneF (UPF0154 family)